MLSDAMARACIIYSKQGCAYCDKALQLLREEGYDITRHELSSLSELRDRLGDVSSFPQIFLQGRHIGGYQQLFERFQEPILRENPDRFSPFPPQYPEIWKLYKLAGSSFWPVEEVKLGKDPADWDKLTEQERFFIKHVLAFFASADGIIQENLAAAFAVEVTIPEARQFFAYQIWNESQHAEMYALLIDALIKDPVEKEHLFHSIQTIPSVKKKADWALKWLDPSKPFAARLVAFACVEGVQFSGSFAAIFWVRKRGLMPGLCSSNEFISRDEGLHMEHGVALYKLLRHKLPEHQVRDIVREAVDHECEFLTAALPVSLIGINCAAMVKYIKHVADRLLQQLGYHKMYNVTHDLDFMELISLSGKVNFFEHTESGYNRHNMVMGQEGRVFGLDADF